jgi:protein gp37
VAENSRIAWTDHSFNPWTGCQRVSKGCVHCYAETWAKRTGRDIWGAKGKRKRTSKSIWAKPKTWNHVAVLERRPRKVFCASLADVFEDAPGPNEWRGDVWELIRACPWLDFQLLTKRPENIAAMLPDDWGRGWPNVWLGTSIEDREVVERARVLSAVPAFVRFISYEPAIGPVFYDDWTTGDKPLAFWSDEGPSARANGESPPQLDLEGIHWLIAGGESGPGHREMKLEWAMDARAECEQEGVAFFFKQIAAFRNEQGADALGRPIREFPASWDRADVDTNPIYAPKGSMLR